MWAFFRLIYNYVMVLSGIAGRRWGSDISILYFYGAISSGNYVQYLQLHICDDIQHARTSSNSVPARLQQEPIADRTSG